MALLRYRCTALVIILALAGCSTTAPADDASPGDRAQPVGECDAVEADELADHPCGQSDWDEPPPAVGDDSQ